MFSPSPLFISAALSEEVDVNIAPVPKFGEQALESSTSQILCKISATTPFRLQIRALCLCDDTWFVHATLFCEPHGSSAKTAAAKLPVGTAQIGLLV